MPIWFEVLALALVAYTIGFGAGWIVFSRTPSHEEDLSSDDAID